MSDKIITFSKTLTVGTKSYKDLDTENPDLGFMTPNTGDSAYQKRLATLKGWCHNGREYDYNTRTWKEIEQNTDNVHEVENVPTTGFQILNAQSRYSTDNKVFRLKDPRGFILEIYTGNLEVILQTSDILKGGYIAEPCVWGRQGANNVLVAVSSDAYKKSVAFAERKTSSFKDLTIGDIVKFKDGTEEIYLGEYVPVYTKRINNTQASSSPYYYSGARHRNPTEYQHVLEKGDKVHAFKSVKHTNINLVKKLSPCVIIDKTDITPDDYYSATDGRYIRQSTNDYSKTIHGIFKLGVDINNFGFTMDLTERTVDINNSVQMNSPTYMVHNETMQIVETYFSRIYGGQITDSYYELVYDPINTKQYKLSEKNLSRQEPLIADKFTIVKGLNIAVDTNIGKVYLKAEV